MSEPRIGPFQDVINRALDQVMDRVERDQIADPALPALETLAAHHSALVARGVAALVDAVHDLADAVRATDVNTQNQAEYLRSEVRDLATNVCAVIARR